MKRSLLSFKLLSTLAFSLLGLVSIQAQTFEVDTIVKRGATDKYINFVYLGDGYTASQQSTFLSHLHNINNDFFERVPFSNYKNFFNVFAIKVISLESGVKHPRSASDCPSASEFPAANPNNYFGTTFDDYGIHRLVVPKNTSKLNSVLADNFPEYDQVLVIGNTTQYGGSGGSFATGTAHDASLEIMLHECGHSFAGLSDEYWAGDVYAGENYNMTNIANATPTAVRWQAWLGVTGTDIYEHCCGGSADQWYKPHNNCLMEYLEREFCPVCRQRVIEKIYETTSPIVNYTPTTATVHMVAPMEFKITELIKPIPNTLKLQWKLNGSPVGTGTTNISITPEMLSIGANTLEVEVKDTTFMLRSAPTFTHHINKVTWTLNKWATGVDINGDNQHLSVQIFPNPATTVIQIQAKGLPTADAIVSFQIVNIAGTLIKEVKTQVFQSEASIKIPVDDVPAGNYFLKMNTSKGSELFKISILH